MGGGGAAGAGGGWSDRKSFGYRIKFTQRAIYGQGTLHVGRKKSTAKNNGVLRWYSWVELVMCTYMYAFVICAGRGGVFPKGFLLLSLLMWSALNHYRCLVLHMIELYLFLFLFCFLHSSLWLS